MSRYSTKNDPPLLFGIFTTRTVVSLILLVVVGFFFILIYNDTIRFFIVPTSSMEPTLMPCDKVIATKKDTYNRGDLVALKDPKEQGAFLAKRIVAIGGDTLSIAPIGLYLNGVLMREPYLQEAIQYEFGPYTVPDDYVFVLGDNRNSSDDSHLWGQGVPANTVVGQLRYIYAPSERRGSLPQTNQAFPVANQ
jgi:signal peptidase I